MLLCCSIIPTSGKFTNKVFVKLISEWVLARHRSEFGTLSWNGESDLFCAGKKGGCFQVELFDEGRKCGIHFVSPGKYKKQSVQWISNFILDSNNKLFAFQLNCEGYVGTDLPRNIPSVVGTIILQGYCSIDGDLKLSNRPLLVNSGDEKWIDDILLHKAKHALPIIYISRDQDGNSIIDPTQFAMQIYGLAHVVFEEKGLFKYGLQHLTSNKYPSKGEVAIIFPDDITIYTPSQLLTGETVNTWIVIDKVSEYFQCISDKNDLLWNQLQSGKGNIKNIERINEKQKEAIRMGKYIGSIKREGENAEFFNFKPIAQIVDSQVIELSISQQEELLPDSEKRDINFSYNPRNQDDCRRMDEAFPIDDSLVVFEFAFDDLHDNFYYKNGTRERNRTGYKVQALEMIERGRIYSINEANIYYAVNNEKLLSDFESTVLIQIDIPYICSGNRVFVEYGDSFWAGPYEVNYSRDYGIFIRPQIQENKYVLNGYYQKNVELKKIGKWTLFIPSDNAKSQKLDVINDDRLLEGFRESVQSNIGEQGMVSLANLSALLNDYDNSILTGSSLTDEIRHSRLARLNKILTSEIEISDTIDKISGSFCDLLIKNQSDPHVDNFLNEFINKNPEILENVKEVKAVSMRIEQRHREYEELEHEVNELREEKEKATEELKQNALKEKDEELRQKASEYDEWCVKLTAIRNEYSLVEEVAKLQEKLNNDRAEEAYLEEHKSRLKRDTDDLRVKFDQFLNEQREKMVQISFDGFMSSRMFHAAGEWDERESNSQHHELVAKVNALPIANLGTDALVEYLCQTVQEVRPSYTRNTIINIAICLTQGFLTVFSGDPGCGKTSICNIFGDVLGLKQISKYVDCKDADKDRVNRYIPISVERGWTSKRDFIGYYNPLSKTFDTANRRVYDALRVLDTEKKENINRLPFVILLDEANLSPMEYYWSDFMNICDDLGPQSVVNLGENFIFGIPETLHFFATINNDHTIEILSPRLIDRSWVISLPRQNNYDSGINEIPSEHIKIISWESLCQAFIPKKETKCEFSPEIKKVYNAIALKMKEQRFLISPRVYNAIKRYWVIASKQFEMDDTKTDPEIIAIDYAVAQRLLPKIEGNGEDFEKWLDEFKSLCSRYGLNESADRLNDIIERGKRQMKYFKFFC